MIAGVPSSALRVAISAVPALVTVIFAGVVVSVALMLDKDRRQYALDFAGICVDLAAVLLGAPRRSLRPPKGR